ncbi:hypothetical protein CDAR_454661 [Caerostris darwini]|uniref:Uncharacterized protein n=1 Tax=Caerostris darwini TaxID=1538125 RepID=A0AAV4TYS6_9ARAC|nr:hypothetical protein CDAR_454661 [Caerostris darwini]
MHEISQKILWLNFRGAKVLVRDELLTENDVLVLKEDLFASTVTPPLEDISSASYEFIFPHLHKWVACVMYEFCYWTSSTIYELKVNTSLENFIGFSLVMWSFVYNY